MKLFCQSYIDVNLSCLDANLYRANFEEKSAICHAKTQDDVFHTLNLTGAFNILNT